MITKERLEELIKQGATIYLIYGKDVEKKPLKHKYHKFFILDNELYEDNEKLGIGIWKHKLSKLFETKEEAEWHKEFGCIERTQKLHLPTWEFLQSWKCYSLIYNGKTKVFIGLEEDFLIVKYDDILFKIYKATKENYTLACRKVKELFLGEKDE